MTTADLSPADLDHLARRGIPPAEAARQLDLLRRPPRFARLDRACTAGDGIERLDPAQMPELERAHAQAATAGELIAFVPASGAASRMFKEPLSCLGRDDMAMRADLERAQASGDGAAAATLRLVDGIDHLALRDEVERAAGGAHDLARLRATGDVRGILTAMLGRDRLDYGSTPKGLIPFHAGPHGPRTPFEEHLADAAALMRDAKGVARSHFTVSPEHRERFVGLLDTARESIEGAAGARLAVEFSEQAPSTDTLAIEGDGRPFRNDDGTLLLRPAGHGALLGNLAALGRPVAFLRNIDNVTAESFKGPTLEWTRRLIGLLVRLREASRRHLAALTGEAQARGALEFAASRFGSAPPGWERLGGDDLVTVARAALDRPLRVCGMVPNAGEPGGGPFWVRGADGAITRQIVESAEVDASDAEQQRLFKTSTHFNPVFMACGLSDAEGRPHPLERFIDADAAIVTRKSSGGRELVALERPGLWNGAMARWNTVFVEVPAAVFHPVKTVLDLLRPEHRVG